MNIQILDRLAVMWGKRPAGELALDRNGAMQFAYAQSWLRDPQALPLSFSLPLRAEPFEDRACKPFFENLLPEEWQREAAARALGISPGNPFRLLQALGGDTAGALTFRPTDQPKPLGSSANAPVPLDDAELAALFGRIVQRPMLAGEGARYSLAGAQSKLPVVLVDNRIALASPGQATTHIIKPEPERFPGLAANEAFCMALAKSIGLNAADAEWRSIGGRTFLLVSRYDRIPQNGAARGLHQEDFAQALGVLPSRKYASDGGPVFRDCFDLVRRAATNPETEVLKLIDAALFNLVIGNADAHAKNFSLLRKANGEVVLAPLYDLVSTVVWPGLSNRFAMKYGGARTLEAMSAGSFERFAADAGVDVQIVRERGALLCERIMRSVEAGWYVPGLGNRSAVSSLREFINERPIPIVNYLMRTCNRFGLALMTGIGRLRTGSFRRENRESRHSAILIRFACSGWQERGGFQSLAFPRKNCANSSDVGDCEYHEADNDNPALFLPTCPKANISLLQPAVASNYPTHKQDKK